MRFIKKIFHNTSIDERGRMRIRRVGLTGITTLSVKGISTTAGIISIPLTAKYLGTERFGLYLILSTFLSWISIADLGLANSLTNALATSDGKENREAAKTAVSSAFWLMIIVMFALTALFSIAYPLVPWDIVFNINSLLAKEEVGTAIIICFIFFIIRLPLSIPGRIYVAYQEGYFYQLWSGFSSILSFIFLIFAIYLKASLPLLIATQFGILLLGDIFAGIHLFYFKRQWLRPDIKYFIWKKSKWLFKTGFQFWIAQISAILIFQTDLIIVAQLFGASTVATYGVTLKLFALIGLVQSAFVNPLWPAYTEALSRKDYYWVIKIFKKSIYISFSLSLVLGFIIFIFSPAIVSSWIGKGDVILHNSLLLAMLFTSVLNSIAQCVGILVNGLGEIRLQAFIAPISAIINLFLSVFLGNLIGVSGVAWATGICLLLFSLIIVGGDILKKLTNMSKTEIFIRGQKNG
jgi:O-antigen/teichoic acid export membrane protein